MREKLLEKTFQKVKNTRGDAEFVEKSATKKKIIFKTKITGGASIFVNMTVDSQENEIFVEKKITLSYISRKNKALRKRRLTLKKKIKIRLTNMR